MELQVSNPYFVSAILALVSLFLGIIIGAWLSSRLAVAEPEVKKEKESTAFLKGLNYLLLNDRDQAIEEFTKAVQINSNTVETYMALGNLFRSKGEVGRAIRIHETIILRPTIDKETKIQAMYDLSLDFKKAGFIKRAVSSLEDVISHDSTRLDAHIQLEELYEETGDWDKAFTTQQRISALKKTQDNNILAHLQTELGKSYFSDDEIRLAEKSFKKALSLDNNCIDALLHLGDLYFSRRDYTKAIAIWKKVMKINPPLIFMVYDRLEKAYTEKNKPTHFEKLLRKYSAEDKSNFHIRLGLAKHLHNKGETKEAMEQLRTVIHINPHSLDARKELGEILMECGKADELISEYQDFLNVMNMPEKGFRCQKCGFESERIQWKCPQCLKWDTIIPKELEPARDRSA